MEKIENSFRLTDDERASLAAISTSARPGSRLARQARTLLALAELKSEWATVEACGVGIEVLRRWRSNFEVDRSLAKPPRDRRRVRTRQQVSTLVKPLLRQSPRKFGYSSDRWDASILRMHLANTERTCVPVCMLQWVIGEEAGA
jgi:hypothetical protein